MDHADPLPSSLPYWDMRETGTLKNVESGTVLVRHSILGRTGKALMTAVAYFDIFPPLNLFQD